MLVFNSDNFSDVDVNYLKFSESFEISISDKIKIILGPNGIGKSSIYRNIQERHPEYAYIDYNDIRTSVINKGNKIVIAPSIATIIEKEKNIKKIIDSIDTKKTMGSAFKLTNSGQCNKISNNLNEYRMNTRKAIDKYNDAKVDIFINLDEKYKRLFIDYGSKVFEIVDEKLELEKIQNDYKKRCLEMVEKLLNEEEHECPICGNTCKESINEIIKRKIKSIEEISNEIIKDYIEKNSNISPQEILNQIEYLKEIIITKEIKIEDLEDYIICGGNKDKSKYIIESKKVITETEKEIAKLESKKIEFYENIVRIRQRIEEVFKNSLDVPVDNIIFNEGLKELEINLTRKVEKYSTGEINLMTFIVSLLEFISSDKNTIIIDDPLSSYDIPNQYRIMYELTAAKNTDNNILIFTHNIDCLNIANSQNRGSYEYELIDNTNGNLYLNHISSLKDNGLSIDYILENLDNTYEYKEYIEILKNKDNLPLEAEEHKLFHYNGFYQYPNSSCNNDELVNIIDSITENSISNKGTITNCANKILYLSALRVWIEKQFYDNNNDPLGFQNKKLLGEKIKFIFDGNHWTGSPSVNKSYIMGKKVMLNQHEHTKSQKEPFYYALSIPMNNIIQEIIDIKNHFNNL